MSNQTVLTADLLRAHFCLSLFPLIFFTHFSLLLSKNMYIFMAKKISNMFIHIFSARPGPLFWSALFIDIFITRPGLLFWSALFIVIFNAHLSAQNIDILNT